MEKAEFIKSIRALADDLDKTENLESDSWILGAAERINMLVTRLAWLLAGGEGVHALHRQELMAKWGDEIDIKSYDLFHEAVAADHWSFGEIADACERHSDLLWSENWIGKGKQRASVLGAYLALQEAIGVD